MSKLNIFQDLWIDPMAALLFVYCADQKRYQRSPIITKTKVVELKTSEVFVDVKEKKSIILISDEVFQKKIGLLTAMQLITPMTVIEKMFYMYYVKIMGVA